MSFRGEETVTLPAFLASALINGDVSGLDEADLPWVEAAHEYCYPGSIVSCGEDTYFGRVCSLPGWRLGCDMLDYVVLYPEEPAMNAKPRPCDFPTDNDIP